MKKIIIVILSLGFCVNARAQWVVDYSFEPVGTKEIRSFSVVDTNIVWILAADPNNINADLYRKINSNVVQINSAPIYRAKDVIGIDSSLVYVSSFSGKLYKSNNAGNNWQIVLSADTTFKLDFAVSKTNPAYIVCTNNAFDSTLNHIFITTNSGLTWTTHNINLQPDYGLVSPSLTDPNHIWIGISCSSGCTDLEYAHSTNGGANWSIKSFSLLIGTVGMVPPIMKKDNTTGLLIAYGFYNYVFRTTNGGTNWTNPILFPSASEPLADFVSADTANIWYCTTWQNLRKSTDDGANWSIMAGPPPDSEQYFDAQTLRRGDKIFVWTCTSLGRILKLRDNVTPIGIQQISNEIPKSFSLWQNYPNPFNPSTKIKFSIPNSSVGGAVNVKIMIYDITGRQIAVLVNEPLGRGTYVVTWDASTYSSGVFFCRMQAGDYLASKKLLLTK